MEVIYNHARPVIKVKHSGINVSIMMDWGGIPSKLSRSRGVQYPNQADALLRSNTIILFIATIHRVSKN